MRKWDVDRQVVVMSLSPGQHFFAASTTQGYFCSAGNMRLAVTVVSTAQPPSRELGSNDPSPGVDDATLIPLTVACSGWSGLGDQEYRVFSDGRKFSFDLSQEICISAGANLASVTSEDENDFIFNTVLDGVASMDVWIGGKVDHETRSQEITWLDGTNATNFTAWNEPRAQPDNRNGNQECITFGHQKRSTGGDWWDQECSDVRWFVCERALGFANVNASTTQQVSTVAPTGSVTDVTSVEVSTVVVTISTTTTSPEAPYLERNGYTRSGPCRYRAFPLKTRFQAAERKCIAEGGHLASVHSDFENSLLSNLTNGDSFWLGLERVERNSDNFTWTDGTPTDFFAWKTGEPNNNLGQEDCVSQNFRQNGICPTCEVGGWNDAMCNDRRGYLCKVCDAPESTVTTVSTTTATGGTTGPTASTASPAPPSPTTPMMTTIGNGLQEQWVSFGEEECSYLPVSMKLDWYDASLWCEARGAYLATPDTEQKRIFLSERFVNRGFWIGMFEKNTVVDWHDPDSSFFPPTSDLSIWQPGQELTNTERCVEQSSRRFRDNDMYRTKFSFNQCANKKYFVCQDCPRKQLTTVSVRPTLLPPPSGWVSFGECYYKSFMEKQTFTVAKKHCESFDANLVSILTGAENNFVSRLAGPQPHWIGLVRDPDFDRSSDVFEWLDGSPYVARDTFWRAGEPNDLTLDEDCAWQGELVLRNEVLNKTEWNDAPCGPRDKREYVCKWCPEFVTTPTTTISTSPTTTGTTTASTSATTTGTTTGSTTGTTTAFTTATTTGTTTPFHTTVTTDSTTASTTATTTATTTVTTTASTTATTTPRPSTRTPTRPTTRIPIRTERRRPAPPAPSKWFRRSSTSQCQYKVVYNEMDYAEAESDCERRKGELVVMSSSGLNTFLALVADTPVWIGLKRGCKDCSFEWSDGSVNRFSNFLENEPNLNSETACVQLGSLSGSNDQFKWSDSQCSAQRAFICQRYC